MTACYKVLSRFKTSWYARDELEVSYSELSWSQAPSVSVGRGFHLFVFDTYRNAYKYIHGTDPDEDCSAAIYEWGIWECECEEEVRIPRLSKELELEMIWRGYQVRDFPTGTKMFKRVKLIKRVT